MGTKKSKFTSQPIIPAGATFDYVSNGENFKIPESDLLAALGVTGTIAQVGEVTGTPVLDVSSSPANLIRNLVKGSGIKTSLSPQNGITLEHDFTFDQTGAPLTPDSAADSPVIRSLIAGSGISVGASGNTIQIALTAGPTSTKTVVINQISDFPTAVAGVIPLAADTDYFLTNDMSTADRFSLSDNTQLRANGTVIVNLTYTGTGAMFSCEDCNVRFRQITFTASTGSFWDVTSSTAAGIGVVACDNVVFIGATFGTASARIFSLFSCAVVCTAGGLTSTATTMDILSVNSCTWIQFAGTCIDLGTTVLESCDVKNVFVTVTGGVTFLSGLINSGNLSATGKGTFGDVDLAGGGATLNNIDPDDSRWVFAANNTVRSTIRDAILSVQGNALETVIASEATPVKANAVFTIGRSSGFTGDITGRVTYNLVNDIVVPITASLTILKASGGTARVSACITVNGTVVAQSCIGTDCSSSTSGNIPLTWQSLLTTGDFVEIFLENPTGEGTVNNVLVDAVFRVQ